METDTDLAYEAATGSTVAFETLVRRHQALIRGLARRLTKGAAHADDIAQAAFLTGWQQIATYRGGSFKAWLSAIAYREFLQDRRRQKPEVTFDESAHIINFDRSAARLADEMDLGAALAALPDAQRICVSLCVAAGLTHREVSDITGWPLGTVKSHVTRGVAALRKYLAAEHVA